MGVEKIGVEVTGTIGSLATAMAGAVGWIKKVDKAHADGATTAQKSAAIGGAALAVVGGAAVAAGSKFISMAGDFQASNTRLETSAGEIHGNLQMVGDGILKMAGDVGDSTQQLESGMYLVESAGYHGNTGLDVLKAAAQGAKAENADLGTVANATTSALNAYGVTSQEAGAKSVTFVNQMVAAVGAGKMTMEDFSGSLSAVLPVAAAAKLSFDQVAGAEATMTGQGMSAQQSAQDLANTIRSLQAPNAVAVKEMAQLGLNSNDVAQNLGKKGLTGTLEELTKAITDHMGPGGQVLMNAFNQSKAAAADADAMIAKMPKSLQGLAKEFSAGKITMAEWHKGIKGLPVDQANVAKQFATTENAARGFNSILKSGSPAAQTYNDALGKMLGGATGLQTTLMLTGTHLDTFKANVKTVGDAAKHAGSDVNGWGEIQGEFNQKMARAKGGAEALGISIGQKLLPAATAVAGEIANVTGWLSQHSSTAVALAGVIGGVLVAAIVLWTATTMKAFVKNQEEMARDIIKGGIWLVQKIGTFVAASASAMTEAAITSGAWLMAGSAMATDALISGGKWVAGMILNFVVASGSAVVQAAITAAAWIAANASMILATGGIILAIGLLVAAGLWLKDHWSQVMKVLGDVAHAAWQWIHDTFVQPAVDAFHMVQGVLDGFGRWWHLFWDGIGQGLKYVYDHTIGPIVNTIGGAISGISNALGSVGNGIGNVAHMLGFEDGGYVPGSKGQARLAVVHGGEYVLSNDMIEGKTSPSPDLQLPTGLGGPTGGAYAAGGAAGGGTTFIFAPIIQGNLIHQNDLFEAFREQALAFLQRNPTNGLTGVGF